MRQILLALLMVMTGVSGSWAEVKLSPSKSPMGVWGYKTPDGEWGLLQVYRAASPFVDGLAAVSFDGRNYAFINQYGATVSDFIFPGPPSGYWKGVFVIKGSDGMSDLYDITGRKLLDKPYEDLAIINGLIVARDKVTGQRHLYDGTMQQFNYQGYEYVKDYPVIVVTPDSTYRANVLYVTFPSKQSMYVDAAGKSLVSEGLTYISSLYSLSYSETRALDRAITDNGLSLVLKSWMFVASPNRGKKYGVYLLNGRNILEPKYGSPEKALNALAKNIKKILVPGVTDGSLGREMVECVTKINEDYSAQAAKNMAQLGVEPIDPLSLPSIRHYVSVKSETKKSAGTASRKKGSSKAKKATSTTTYYFENSAHYTPLSDERFPEIIDNLIYFYVRKPGSKKYNLYNSYGEQMTFEGYDEIKMWGYNKENDAMFLVRDGKEWGIVNVLGDEVLAPQYESIDITSQTTNVVCAKRDGMCYLLDGQRGRLINNTPYDEIKTHLEQKGMIPVKRLGYETKVDSKGKEHPSIGELAYNEAVALEGTPEEKVTAYGKSLELCGKDDRNVIGACYNNIGVIYMNAGDRDTAKKFYQKAASYGNSVASSNLDGIKSQERSERWQAVSGALSTLAEGLSTIGGGNSFASGFGAGLSGGGQYGGAGLGSVPMSAGDDDYSTTPSASSSSGKNKLPESYYQNTYRRWEDRAKDLYESLTRQGTRTKTNGEYTSGTSEGYWKQKYVGLKKNLRDAQAQMRKTRQEARRDGYSIPQSNYETVTVTN